MNTNILQFTTFWVEQNWWGVNVLDVQEILHDRKITPVALLPDHVQGLMNLRGDIVTVLDLRRLFGLPPRPDDTPGMYVVTRAADEAIGLGVDRMAEIVETTEEQLLPPPDTSQADFTRYLSAVCQVNDNLLLLLDLEAIIGHNECHTQAPPLKCEISTTAAR